MIGKYISRKCSLDLAGRFVEIKKAKRLLSAFSGEYRNLLGRTINL